MKNLRSILILFAIVLIYSCNQLTVDPLANYIIDKGTHDSYSYSQTNRKRDNIIAPILIRGNRLDFGFTFKENHKYNYTIKDGGDINKLYGITSIKVHKNSARFGWRYVGNDEFEVFAYYYIRGVRDWQTIGLVHMDVPLNFSVDVSGHQYTFGMDGTWVTIPNTKNFLAARSFPYYGGDLTAPHTMYFQIIEF